MEMFVQTFCLFLRQCTAHTMNDEYDIDITSFGSVVEYGSLQMVKHLVEKGADIHAQNDFALRTSARYGHLEIVTTDSRFALRNTCNRHVVYK